jgi:hypothetical protein
MCLHAVDGRAHCLDAPVASWASHYLVGMTVQGVFDRDANPLATPFHFAAIVHPKPRSCPLARVSICSIQTRLHCESFTRWSSASSVDANPRLRMTTCPSLVSAFTAYSMCPSVTIILGRIKPSFAPLRNAGHKSFEKMVSRAFQTRSLEKSGSPPGKCRGCDTTIKVIAVPRPASCTAALRRPISEYCR